MNAEKTLICYRGACENAAHPCGYNRITHGLYCLECVDLIERRRMDRGSVANYFPLRHLADQVTGGGAYEAGVIKVITGTRVIVAHHIDKVEM